MAREEYVCGFVFDESKSAFVGMHKTKPAWMAGKINGIGGKVERGDINIFNTMCRETQEEIGITTHPNDWEIFAVGRPPGLKIFFFRMFNDKVFSQAYSNETEIIMRISSRQLPDNVVDNLNWLIPLAICKEKYSSSVQFDIAEAHDMERGDLMAEPGKHSNEKGRREPGSGPDKPAGAMTKQPYGGGAGRFYLGDDEPAIPADPPDEGDAAMYTQDDPHDVLTNWVATGELRWCKMPNKWPKMEILQNEWSRTRQTVEGIATETEWRDVPTV